ncbi:AAA family ATPase [Bdellovibrionota bacterium FG-2]
MVYRTLKLSKNNSFFLFGPRGTGKSTLLRNRFSDQEHLWIDLLKDEDEETFRRHPQKLSELLTRKHFDWVVIDEVQKLPKLLDIVQLEIEQKKTKFALTGSSARKLKRGNANMLGGRAFSYHLFPLTHLELGESFDLDAALSFGGLPKLLELSETDDRHEYLRGYVRTYLKEEIVAEQIVRKIDPFRDFLKIAAQTNGQIVNFSKIATDVGVDDKTVHTYFQILEDTLLGFFLPSYHRSIRKRQREAPKFYLFDTGVKRSLDQTLRSELVPQTYAYGKAFEHWVILEAFRLNEYLRLDYDFSYLRTKDDAEIDLIIDRPGEKPLLVEIKSSTNVDAKDATILERFAAAWKAPVECHVWSLDPNERKSGKTLFLPWKKGLQEAGLVP